MIGQIEKRKKGRPSKADLARRAAVAAEDGEYRRSSRKRSVRYNLDLDDFEEEEREEERRREKRLKVVLSESARRQARRVDHPPPESDDDDVENEIEEETEVLERKAGTDDADSAPGTPTDLPADIALPDKNTLELILDKLQKKDTYGVYAEPVDPDELPDYYDVIEHPMDFATVRKKLGKGSYSTLEQFENDVLLICSNAMQYNAPDTIYHKQAISIQELAKRRFQRLRSGSEQDEKELDSEQKIISNSLNNDKQIKKPISRIAPETVASDLSSGATLVTLEENLQPVSKAKESGLERPSNADESIDGNSTPIYNNFDKAEDLLPGRGQNYKFGKKPLINDENRRGTYDLSTQPVSQPDTVFSTFNDEIKQLVAVGLHGDHAYARSLARFAATLGPVAWNIASKRIQQSLSPGIKFDRGWVGDYEPISTPVLINCPSKETIFHQELKSNSNPNTDDKIYNAINSPYKSPFIFSQKETFSRLEVNSTCKPNRDAKNFNSLDSMHDNPFVASSSEGKSGAPVVNTTVSTPTSYCVPFKLQSSRGEISEMKPNNTACVSYQVRSPRTKISQAEKMIKKGLKSNSPPSSANLSPIEVSIPKHIPNNGFVEISQVANAKLPNNGFGIDRTVATVNDLSQVSMPNGYFSHGQEQSLTDPVQVMRKLTENSQKQQKSTNCSAIFNPLVPHSRKEDPSNTTSAAARAWMSIGAGNHKSVSENRNQIFMSSLHNPTQVSRFRNDLPVSGMQLHPMNNNQMQGFMAPQFQRGNETQFQNRPQIVFPHLATTDLSRFQMQSSPRQHQRQETSIPPDLNVVFQSSGSPRSQSSGVHMDSQQPDLALQL